MILETDRKYKHYYYSSNIPDGLKMWFMYGRLEVLTVLNDNVILLLGMGGYLGISLANDICWYIMWLWKRPSVFLLQSQQTTPPQPHLCSYI